MAEEEFWDSIPDRYEDHTPDAVKLLFFSLLAKDFAVTANYTKQIMCAYVIGITAKVHGELTSFSNAAKSCCSLKLFSGGFVLQDVLETNRLEESGR